MTARFHGDTLMHRNKTFELIDQPLERYFALIGSRPSFEPASTKGRGYGARWMVEDGWLFLVSISARWSDDEALSMRHLFPFAGNKVFAAWYKGDLRGYERNRPLPDMNLPERVRYPDVTLNIAHGRVNNAVMAEPAAAMSVLPESETPAQVIEMANYRRPEAHAAWEEMIV